MLIAAIVAALAGRASAADRFWINTVGGDWYDQQNWSTSLLALPPATVPGIGDIARFEVGGISYTVTFADVVDLKSVLIPSDFVTFDLQTRQFATTQVMHIGTQLNDIGSLTVRNGTISSPVVFVGFGQGDGRLLIEADAIMTVDGAQNGAPVTFGIGGVPGLSRGIGLTNILGTLNVLGTDSVVGGILNSLGTADVLGGTWTNEQSLVIGRDGGTGHVLIDNGGVVSVNQTTFVGHSGRTNEFVDITGTGNLTITNGLLTSVGTATIGSAANSFGEADLVGSNSTWDIGGFLLVAESGIGNLHIRNGANARVQNDTLISVGTNEGLLNVTGFGSLVNDGSLFIGGSSFAAGGPGHLLVQSDGTAEVAELLKVWETGTLTIDGGTVTTSSLMVNPGATLDFNAGHLIIDSGVFNIPLNLDFGGTNPFNPPIISLINGAVANVVDLTLGAIPGTFVVFDLDNTSITATDDINVGGDDVQNLGSGVLSLAGGFANVGDMIRIWNDGEIKVSSGHISVAQVRLTGGTMTIEGSGSTVYVDATGNFPGGLPGINIGFTPALTEWTIENGGDLTAPDVDLNVAADAASFALATVTGLDSTMITRDGSIGTLGDGTLNVFDQANVTFNGDLTLGHAPNSLGGVTIDGAGSTVTCEGTAIVGRQGFGQLRMTKAGMFRSLGDTMIGSLVAPVNPAPGFVILDGGNWTSDQSIYVGGDTVGPQGGGSQIFLKTGSTITNQGAIQVWSTGKLSLEGGDLRTRDLLVESTTGLDLLAGSVIVHGGQFRFPSTAIGFGNVDSRNPFDFSFVNGANGEIPGSWSIGSTVGTFGTTTVKGVVNGSRSRLLGTGLSDLVVGEQGDGELDVADGGLVDFGDDCIVGMFNNGNGVVRVHGVTDGLRATIFATRTSDSVISVGGFHEGLSTGGSGDLDIFDGGLVHATGDVFFGVKPSSVGSLLVTGSEDGFEATLQVDGSLYLAGSVTAPGGAAELIVGQGGLIDVGETLRVWPSTFVHVVGGTIRANHLDLTDSSFGTTGLGEARIETNQVSGDLVNVAGTFAPGNSPADVILDGNYTQGASAELEIELAGDDPGSGYDRLQVTGTATLDGTLRVMLVNDYVPSNGHIFTVLTYGDRVGEFSEILTDPFLNFEVVYGDNQLQLLVQDVPVVAGDLNSDGVVNTVDHAFFHSCMAGPNSVIDPSPECDVANIDNDLDVDLADFRMLQAAFGNVSSPVVVRWNSLFDGLWSNINNWLGGALPGAGQSGIINVPGADIAVTLDADVTFTDRLDNLLCNERLRLDGGALSVVGTFQMNNTLEIDFGRLVDTTVDLGIGGLIKILRFSTLDNVTINGNMDQITNFPTVTVLNGLTLNGDVRLAGRNSTSGSSIRFEGPNKFIDGIATISFVSTGNKGGASIFQNDGGNLHIRSGVTIRGTGGVIGQASAPLVQDGLIHSDQIGPIEIRGFDWVNNGTLRASGTGSVLRSNGSWTNYGAIEVFDDGRIILDGTYQNLGTLTTTNADVRLDGEFTIADLGTYQFINSTVVIEGTLVNDLGFVLDADQFHWQLGNGTVQGGTISSGDNTPLDIVNGIGGGRSTLDGVTLNADMVMSGAISRVLILNGLTLNGTIRMSAGGNSFSANIRVFGPNRTIDGTGRIEFLNTNGNAVFPDGLGGVGDSGVMTIGTGITIVGAAGTIGQNGQVFASSLVNNGTIHSDRLGLITVSGTDWINNGVIQSSGGGQLFTGNSWTNNGVLDIGPGPFFDSGANFTQSSTGTFVVGIKNTGAEGNGLMLLNGTASLDGVLRLEFDATFVPTVGQSFTVLAYGDHIGEFATIEIVGLDSDFVAVPNYKATNLVFMIQQP